MGAVRALGVLLAELVDDVWPARCALCAGADRGDGLGCAEHRFAPGLAGPRCGRCAAAVASMLADGERCPACRARAPGFARVAAVAEYRAGANAEWLLALKYGGRPDLARSLGALLAREPAAEDGARRLLVPVPLHAARRVERGYDQALLLARAAGEVAGLPVARLVRRARATAVQGSIETSSRCANVRGAFRAAACAGWRARWAAWRSGGASARGAPRGGPLAGFEAWLVDDVLTSGATAAECARSLRRLGAARVGVLCVARA